MISAAEHPIWRRKTSDLRQQLPNDDKSATPAWPTSGRKSAAPAGVRRCPTGVSHPFGKAAHGRSTSGERGLEPRLRLILAPQRARGSDNA